MSQLERATIGAAIVHNGSDRGNALHSAGYVVTLISWVAEACTCKRVVCVNRQPAVRLEIIIELKSGAAAPPTRVLGTARVTEVDNLGGPIQLADSQCGLLGREDVVGACALAIRRLGWKVAITDHTVLITERGCTMYLAAGSPAMLKGFVKRRHQETGWQRPQDK